MNDQKSLVECLALWRQGFFIGLGIGSIIGAVFGYFWHTL